MEECAACAEKGASGGAVGGAAIAIMSWSGEVALAAVQHDELRLSEGWPVPSPKASKAKPTGCCSGQRFFETGGSARDGADA